MPRSRGVLLGLICGAATLLVVALYQLARDGHEWSPLLRWDLRFRSFVARQGQVSPPDPSLLFLAIDNESVSLEEIDLSRLFADVPRDSANFRALSLMAQQWPWPRELYGLILDRLVEAGAKVVVFDLIFPKETPGDGAFAISLDRHRERVIIGSNFEPQALGEDRQAWQHAPPTDALVPQKRPVDERVAFVNFWTDADEVVRRAQFRVTAEGLSGMPRPDAEVYMSLAARAVSKAGFGDLVPGEIDAGRLFRYAGPPFKTFHPIPLYQLFAPKYWEHNLGGGTAIRDRIVVIGPYGNWQHDFHQTPYGQMPGPELHLNVINALLHGAFLQELSGGAEIAIILVAGLLAWAVGQMISGPLPQALATLGVNAAALLGSVVIYNSANLFIPTITALAAFNLTGSGAFVFQFLLERRERARVRRTLERYVSRDVVREVLDNRASFLNELIGARKSITILFSDLRGFTALTERTDPIKLVAQLNEYLDEMVRIVFRHSGTLDKFIGDAVMAHWGGIRSEGLEADARHAVAAALSMRQTLELLNLRWQSRGIGKLALGIGLNHGEAIVGNVGSQERMEVSVIGDPVNLASRLESATKEYHVDLLLGETMAPLVRDAFILRTVDLLRVKGKTLPVEVSTVLDERTAGTPEPDWLAPYEKGIQLYRRREFAAARECFGQSGELRPGDWLIGEYIRRSEAYLQDPPSAEWDGVYTMLHK